MSEAAPGTLSCRELVELVTDYLDGALPVDLRDRFESHLQGCPDCRTHLDQMRLTVSLLGRLSADDLAPADQQALLDAFHEWRGR